MAEQSAQATDTRIDGAIAGMTPAVETIQAFARGIAQMSGQALRNAHRIEEAAAIQADFLKESIEQRHDTQENTSICWRLPARAGETGKCGSDGRGSQPPNCGQGRAQFQRCP
jgi:uncharacterized low-complexity protein